MFSVAVAEIKIPQRPKPVRAGRGKRR